MSAAAAACQRVLVYGGKGALGSTIVSRFKKDNWWVGSIDLSPNENADLNILVKSEDSWQDQSNCVLKGISDALKEDKVDAIFCVAGGWAGGNAAHKDLIKNSELMWKQSVWSSVIAAEVAVKHLRNGGVLQLTGAKAALEGTPGMIGYGMAKAAVHQLVKSLASENSGLPSNASVIGILPVTLDTPMNRKWMATADKSTWTSMDYVSDLLFQWSNGENVPKSGSLVQLITTAGQTQLNIV